MGIELLFLWLVLWLSVSGLIWNVLRRAGFDQPDGPTFMAVHREAVQEAEERERSKPEPEPDPVIQRHGYARRLMLLGEKPRYEKPEPSKWEPEPPGPMPDPNGEGLEYLNWLAATIIWDKYQENRNPPGSRLIILLEKE